MTYQGYHAFRLDPADVGEHGEPIDHGSFEVFYDDADEAHGHARNFDGEGNPVKPGFYWWACFPGCMPDGEPTGPFETAREAYEDALNG